jgi:hypothetical protein
LNLFSFSQTKLDLITTKCNKMAEIEMVKIENVNEKDLNLESKTGAIWRVIPTDCKTVITNANLFENIYQIEGQYIYKILVYTNNELLTTNTQIKYFTAKAKAVLDDFVVNEFITKVTTK